jgi:hydrogenase-4 membrane subunit HyfE
MEKSSHERKVFSRYNAELFGALILYGIVLTITIYVGEPLKNGLEKTLILITPMGPFLLMIWVIVRLLRRVDEYLRLTILENVSIAAAVTAATTFTYGFMENAGYPRVSMFAVWPVMGAAWILVGVIRCALDR